MGDSTSLFQQNSIQKKDTPDEILTLSSERIADIANGLISTKYTDPIATHLGRERYDFELL